MLLLSLLLLYIISIHAPSRERPQAHKLIINNQLYFNPRSLTGATLNPGM